ncbi:MAG: hypothetical protein OEV64_09305 [Desulfobulbaceae bacterium]|nr:hypothetical protein [Desulfobulbaceae bacterium]
MSDDKAEVAGKTDQGSNSELNLLLDGDITITTARNPGFKDLPGILYHPVIDGEKQNVCAESADVALLLGLQIKYDGRNSQFTKMACRMLGIKSKWAE